MARKTFKVGDKVRVKENGNHGKVEFEGTVTCADNTGDVLLRVHPNSRNVKLPSCGDKRIEKGKRVWLAWGKDCTKIKEFKTPVAERATAKKNNKKKKKRIPRELHIKWFYPVVDSFGFMSFRSEPDMRIGVTYKAGKRYQVEGKIETCCNGFHCTLNNKFSIRLWSRYKKVPVIVSMGGDRDVDRGSKMAFRSMIIKRPLTHYEFSELLELEDGKIAAWLKNAV